MQQYLIFTYDLGYGGGLPVILPVSESQKALLLALKEQEFSDDDYISFDENYVSVNSVLQSMKFISLPIDIEYDFSYAETVINMILNYAKTPVTFADLTLSDVEAPKSIPTLSANEQAVNDLKRDLEPYLKKEKSDPDFDPTAIITQLGQDTRIFSSLEDLVVSAELFGICPECDAVRQEEGRLTCISYGVEKPYTT